MTFSPLADMSLDMPAGNRWNQRNSPILGVMWHHQAGVNMHGEGTNPNREVSANYWITNEGSIIPQVDEENRAWTTGAAGYPAGAAADHRYITFEISNSPEGVQSGTWAISNAAWQAVIKLTAEIFKRRGLGVIKRGTWGGIAVHQDFVATACPGSYIMTHLGQMIADAEKIRSGAGGSGSAPVVNPPTPGLPTSIAELARQTIAGVYGNGQERKNALGARYDEVMVEVNRQLGISQPNTGSKSISQLADEVIAGVYGNGQDRVNALGPMYSAVQAEVDRRYSGTSGVDARISRLADRTQAGEFGNGQERANALGADYAAVQAEVNRRLYG